MNRRQIIPVVIGFIVGLLVGMVLIGSSDDLRESLFGTAGSEKETEAKVEHYLVDMASAEEWLTETYPDNTKTFQASVSVLTKLPGAVNFPVDFKAAQQDIDILLPYAYGALMNIDSNQIDTLEVKSDTDASACLGLDDDPYDGTTMYFYLTVPTEEADTLEIPKEWQKLDDPQTNVLYWKVIACYPTKDKIAQ